MWAKPGPSGPRNPVLIFFHGGAWVKGRREEYDFVAKAYAARGFVVVVPDYRKVPQVRFPAFVEDGASAVRWVRDNIARYGGDPDRVVLSGHSAGGHTAMMLALDRRYLSAVGVDPGIVRAVVGLAGPYDFYPFTSPRAVSAMANAPDLRMTQPVSFARADAPPLWLGHGTRRYRGPAAQLGVARGPATRARQHDDRVAVVSGEEPQRLDHGAFQAVSRQSAGAGREHRFHRGPLCPAAPPTFSTHITGVGTSSGAAWLT